MAYVATRGGERAIEQAERLFRQDLGTIDAARVETIRLTMPYLIDRVMGEASLYDEELAALALAQTGGELSEAVLVLRAWRTTQPRLAIARPVQQHELLTQRRISAAFKDIPGGQILGPTLDYSHRVLATDVLEGRPFAPKGSAFEAAVADWRTLASDEGAAFDREVSISGADIAPTVTWGTSPEQAAPITASVPDPDSIADEGRAAAIREAIAYMGLRPGQPLQDIRIDRVFIGSCTNSRIEDLRAAAAVLAGHRVRVPGIVSPGSADVKRQAEEEGLDAVFRAAGLDWVDPGCSMCVGMNGDTVPAGERCASTTNRNFKGRQGSPTGRTVLMSPVMVAAAAIQGSIADAREVFEIEPAAADVLLLL